MMYLLLLCVPIALIFLIPIYLRVRLMVVLFFPGVAEFFKRIW